MAENVDNEVVESVSADDVPLPLDQDNTDDDLPIDQNILDVAGAGFQNQSEVLDDYNTGHAAIMEQYISNENIFDAYSRLGNFPNKDEMVKGKAKEKSLVDAQDLQEVFIENPGDNAAAIRENADLVREVQGNMLAAGEDTPRQIVDAASAPSVEPEKVQEVYSKLRVMEDVTELVADRSVWDTVADAFKMFIPGKVALDNAQLTGSVFGADKGSRSH